MMPPMADLTGFDAPDETTPPEAEPTPAGDIAQLPDDGQTGPDIVLAILAILVAVCFFPLLRYFFSQDDFYLIYRSTHDAGDVLASTFGSSSHHFRPLTKTFYFAGAYRIFGLHPLPFHVVSLVLHLYNSLLVYTLLRNLRLSAAPAGVSTALFALSVAFFHAIGWISCIQQLAGALFLLLTIFLAITALRNRSMTYRILSVVTYVLALLSMEQTFLAPLFVFLIAVFALTGRRYSIASTWRVVWPHVLILCVYSAIRLLWKGVPSEGITRFAYGDNVIFNVAAYLSAMYTYWPDVSNQIPYRKLSMTPSHYILLTLVIYNVVRLRVRAVVFSLVFMLATLLPALFLLGHLFYYHTYIPAFGAIYLIGLAIEDMFALMGRAQPRTRWQLVVATAVIVAIAVVSSWKVRVIESRTIDHRTRPMGSFVLRRAIIAKAAHRDLTAKAGDMTGVRRVDMVFGWPGRERTGGRPRDLYWAFSNGYAVRVFFDEYDLEDVQLQSVWAPEEYQEGPDRRVFFYDPAGNCYTYDEMNPEPPPKNP